MGWEFSFQSAITNNGLELRSWEEWKDFLQYQEIIDEYDRIIPYQDFINIVEGSRGPTKLNHVDFMNELAQTQPYQSSDNYWKDDAGWAFTNIEFR
jgi:hypothetical protein